jgi:hypothetical protein
MSTHKVLPDWIVAAVEKHKSQINSKSLEYFLQVSEISFHFNDAFLNIPTTADLGVLKVLNPAQVQEYYGNNSAMEFILFNILESFHYQSTYQLREVGLTLADALGFGRFYVAALTNRAMLEVVCINYYTFRRVEQKFEKSILFVKEAAKTKSRTEREKYIRKYVQEIFEIVSSLVDADNATSMNWEEYLKGFGISGSPSGGAKKIHVLSAIEDLEKASKMPLKKSYDLLSEFAHPNGDVPNSVERMR